MQPLAIQQACLVPLALSAPSHKRTVNGCAAACGQKKFNLSEGIAWFGDILNREGPIVEIGPRSVVANPAVGGWQ